MKFKQKIISYIIFILLLISFSECINHSIVNQEKKSLKLTKDNLIDSLEKYSTLNEALKIDDSSNYVFCINEINNRKIAIITFTDSVFFLFQKNSKNNWTQIDSGLFETYAHRFEETNLNDDGNTDLIMYGFPDVHGESEPFVFISNDYGELHYRSDIKLYKLGIPFTHLILFRFYYH
ncbi:MAG: hypothetical protein WCK02_17210, partial [Bacteroidota bacterium]